MKRALPALLALLLPVVANAQANRPAQGGQPGPQRLGISQNWTAATHQEGGQKVCYAFTRATKTEGGGPRQNVILTVTHRPQGRDQVAASLGFSFPRNADRRETTVEASVGSNDLSFYGAGTNAFAQNGGAAVAAFRNGRDVVFRSPGPQGKGATTDTFSLMGFSAAYEAISRECPARR
ncbi:hypothetical protein LPC08_23285 [Roseomonas sp. OT10]|uniref:hypothetical protein n=1 Tax=Roseomonas cutis TaxID=2897332 RepID=UPI001E282659|nr:hypothetical protein [Roseomonas sp. OT10]UFN48885.1 hypothetical protein LPC08_23285 [Roseomonas sp. OT10]